MTTSSASLMPQEFMANSQDANSRQPPPPQSHLNNNTNHLVLNTANTPNSNNTPVPNTPLAFKTHSIYQDQLLDNRVETGNNGSGHGVSSDAHTTINPTPIHTINEHILHLNPIRLNELKVMILILNQYHQDSYLLMI